MPTAPQNETCPSARIVVYDAIYVHLPGSHKVAVLDLDEHSVRAKWGTGMALANYPVAFDEADHRLFVVTRMPARLLVFDNEGGKILQRLPVVGDCDDLFKGARTGLFSADLDRFLLAVLRRGSQPAAIQIFAPRQ